MDETKVTLDEPSELASSRAGQAAQDQGGSNDDANTAVAGEPAQDPVAVAQAEAARLRDQLVRTAADFDNFRKRSRRELTDAERRAKEDLLRELLPVFDNLERASAHAGQATDVKSLVEGIDMVMRGFLDTLSKIGVERVESIGKAFDPALHEALQQLQTKEFPPGTIAAEIQAGYKMGDRLVRPALVVVAKPPAEPS